MEFGIYGSLAADYTVLADFQQNFTEMLAFTLLAGILIVFLIYIVKEIAKLVKQVQYQRECVGEMAGPKSTWIFGSLLEIPREEEKMDEWFLNEAVKAAESGASMMRVWYGHILRIYLLDGESTRIMTNSSEEIVKGRTYDLLQRWMGEGLLTSHGQKWSRNRRLMTPTFHFQKLDEYHQIMDRHVKRLVELLEVRADGREIDFFGCVKYLTMDVILEAAMGAELNLQENNDHPYIKAVHKFADLLVDSILNPLTSFPGMWTLLGFEKRMCEAVGQLQKLTKQVVESRMAEHRDGAVEPKVRPDFLDILLREAAAGRMNEAEVAEQVNTFLFAGHDTTAHAIAWTIWCLATNPDAQRRLHEELQTLDADLSAERLRSLKYLDAVIRESLRIFPAVPFVEREIQTEMEICGQRVPKGCQVVIAPFLLHHNPNIYNDHWTFQPERFLGGSDYGSHEYIPFSAGPRNCIGMRFALAEVRIVVAHMVWNFEIRADKQMRENWCFAELVLRPGLGTPIRLRRRFG